MRSRDDRIYVDLILTFVDREVVSDISSAKKKCNQRTKSKIMTKK